ncbi:MAG: rhodanese-related sulfurtransferase [Gammaproteobacteria bacterium]|jgi:rhodanese-related sulfurtransferase
MPSPNEITISQASRLIGLPESPVFIDLRIDADFDDDPRLIPTAFRHSFKDVESLVPRLQGQRVIVYCQKGKKVSQGGSAILRHHGIQVESLEGGQFAWRDANLPMVPDAIIPERNNHNQTVWVTKHRPKIDRIACPWLIRRFVDPKAMFLFVAPAEVLEVADKFNATPFDVDAVFWSHRGENCTFDSMLEEFQLTTKPLKTLAEIVRGADTDKLDLTPQSAGLLAASLGLSRMYRDDNAQLDAGMLLYDMYYRWARDATYEGHDWPAKSTKG